jgi:ComF family protein
MRRGIWEGLKDILYPKICLACRQPLKGKTSVDELVCAECWKAIKMNRPPFCRCCGRHLDKQSLSKNICPVCIKKELHFDRAYSACAYEGALKELIHAFKYRQREQLARTLSRPMIRFIKDYSLPLDFIEFILPIPLSADRLREREFNQAEALGGYIAREFNRPLTNDKLYRLRRTKSQTGLKDEERFQNIKGSFAVRNSSILTGKNLLLVDDVLTTGATASEAARTLKEAGAGAVFVLTLAN